MKPETNNDQPDVIVPKIDNYVLVAAIDDSNHRQIVEELSGQNFLSIADMIAVVEKRLGRFDEAGWCIFPAEYYRELWNDADKRKTIAAVAEYYIAFLYVIERP